VYRDDAGRQHIYSLAQHTDGVTVGRRDEADISVPWDHETSRLHAELVPRAGEWTVTDDGLSQNGTWVNGLRLTGRRRLRNGDLLRVGRTVFSDGDGINPASDEQIAVATGIPLEAVVLELDHLGRALGLEDMPQADQRAEIALLAVRSGLVSADEGG
jgi:predicted component of type VI protein secretion system